MSTENQWQPSWVRGGRVLEAAWIGKDILAWCSGMHIIFFDVIKQKQTLRWCSSHDFGNGASCITGHLMKNIFAFAEKAFNPRILVYIYPSMTKISECVQNCSTSYLATAFVSDKYLISSTSYPECLLTIWFWRTGEKLTSVESWITDAENYSQCLKASYSKPALVAQLGLVSGQVCIWEINAAYKTIILNNYKVTLPEGALAQGIDWCPKCGDPLLAITDNHGHIYLSNQDGSVVNRIVLSQHCGVCSELEVAAICWFQNGIVLKTTFCQIRFYNKINDEWRHDWHIKSNLKSCVLTAYPLAEDRLFYHSQEGYLMQITFPESQNKPVEELRLFYGAIYNQIDFVYPWCHHLVAVDNPTEISLLESYSGIEIKKLNTEMSTDLVCLTSHLFYPLVAMTSKGGEFSLINLVNPQEPRILGKYHLQKTELDLITFSQCGRFILVGDKKDGKCYCISLYHPKTISVIAKLQIHKQIADAILCSTEDRLKLYVLFASSKQAITGYQLYSLTDGSSQFIVTNNLVELENNYQCICRMPRSSDMLLGIPFLSRQIHVLCINNRNEIKILDALSSSHHVRLICIFTDSNWVTSSGPDGLAIIRSGSDLHKKSILIPHHRKDFGVIKTIVNPSFTIIISLGKDGSIVAAKQSEIALAEDVQFETNECEKIQQKILDDYRSLDSSVTEMLSHSFVEFSEKGTNEDITWLEWMQQRKINEETSAYTQKKDAIRKDFTILREKIVKLLDENESYSEIERLPLSDFDLDKVTRERRLQIARDERENTRQKLEANCESLDAIFKWMKSTFWDRQSVLRQSLFSISGKREITNYALVTDDSEVFDYLNCAQFVEDLNNEVVCPNRFYTKEQFDSKLDKQMRLGQITGKQMIDALIATDKEDLEPNSEEVEIVDALGTTTHYFIKQSDQLDPQFESNVSTQNVLDDTVAKNDCKRLQLYFNKLFNDMNSIKERELLSTRERIDRIRHIDSELRSMFGQSISEIPLYPEWDSAEKPENVVKVEDHEMKAKPYVSPSHQKLLNRQIAEAEKRRQLLTDDFPERALNTMMDGVLDIRWEDVIKKDIPRPQCMLIKQPDQYTNDEVQAVKQYEKDVENLYRERERYKKILETDYIKVKNVYEESIEKFDIRHKEFHKTKLKVEAAILQLNLRLVRAKVRHMHRIKSLNEDDVTGERIAQERQRISMLMGQMEALREIYQELNEQLETLSDKRKMMMKKFKSDASSMKKGVLKILWNLYTKQPGVLKHSSASDISDLKRSIATSRKVAYLLPECVTYLKALDIMDVKPAGLISIDDDVWEHFVSLRRMKIQLDLKIKVQELNINEVNQLMQYCENKIIKYRYKIQSGIEQRKEIRQKKIEFDSDIEVQLVLKMAQVEISCSGSFNDTMNSIFVPRQEVETVNRAIQEAGDKKLTIMNRTVALRRGTLFKEWKHRYLKLYMKELNEDVSYIKNISVTKEIQANLKRQIRNSQDNTQQRLERTLEATKRNCEKLSKEWLRKLANVELKIKAVKRDNVILEKRIVEMNVRLCELKSVPNFKSETTKMKYIERKMKIIKHKSDLIRRIKENNKEIRARHREFEILKKDCFSFITVRPTLFDDINKI